MNSSGPVDGTRSGVERRAALNKRREARLHGEIGRDPTKDGHDTAARVRGATRRDFDGHERERCGLTVRSPSRKARRVCGR